MQLNKANMLFPTLLTVALFTSPMAFAGQHGDGKWDKEHHHEKMQKRFDTIAERLELTPAQRETWDEIQAEWAEKRAKKMKKWQEKMAERCAE